nr:MAG TPA: Putative ABC-transporter type IV [Caudoviricetes sp.]
MSSRHILQQKKVQVIRMHRLLNKYLFLFDVGGLLYILIELAWRGWSHWTMFILGGICFIYLGLINEVLPWSMPLWQQILIGAVGITILEFLTGCIVNLWLGWDVWDYSGMPGNILGQICPQYMLLWLPVALAGIVLDDWIRYWKFGEERPHYRLI